MASIIVFDPRADALAREGESLQRLASGATWSEGPVWIPKNNAQPGGGGYLLFSDVPRNEVMKWKEGEWRKSIS